MLKALKPMTYATRRLKAGDLFHARTSADERVLIALKRARRAARPATEPEEEDEATQDDGAGDIQQLRAAYRAKTGKRPYHGWDAAALTVKISEADADD